MTHIEKCVNRLISEKTVTNLIVRAGCGEQIVLDIKKSSENRTLTDKTLFDMASVTKIVATTSLFMVAADNGLISPDDSVSKFFDVPSDKKDMRLLHLLTHTMGYGHKSLLGSNGIYREIQNYILSIPLAIPIGSDVIYSCAGFILLGRIIEKVFGKRLDSVFSEIVAAPLNMRSTGFLPDRTLDIVNANLSADDVGLVKDYNCRYLGGVCGNAGLFSDLNDMTLYAKMLIARGEGLCSEKTFSSAVKNYTPRMSQSRGLGFLYVDGRYSQTGGLFPEGSIGHCGHAGQSVFVNLQNGFYVIILSDAAISTVRKYGTEKYSEVKDMRRDLHAAIKADLEGGKYVIN